VEIANGDGAFAQANWDLAIQHYQAAAGHMQSELAASRIQRAQNFSRCEGLVANAAQAVQATRLTEAQALLTKALKLNPDHAHAASLQGEISGQQALVAGLFKRANAAQKANRWDEGLDLYVAAQRLWSDNDSVLAGLAACTAGKAIADGDAAASQSNWADAAKHYGEALEHANTPATQKAFAHANYMGHFGDGEAHEHAGETQSALEAYQRAAAHEATPEVMRRIGALEQILQHEQEQVGPPGQH
jgi:tetratricopeptide (TPR) repeat protein